MIDLIDAREKLILIGFANAARPFCFCFTKERDALLAKIGKSLLVLGDCGPAI